MEFPPELFEGFLLQDEATCKAPLIKGLSWKDTVINYPAII
jgi:hypothetical protein